MSEVQQNKSASVVANQGEIVVEASYLPLQGSEYADASACGLHSIDKRPTRPQLIILTKQATAELLKMIKKRRLLHGKTLGVRIKLLSKGCGGNSYSLEYVEEQEKYDEVVEIACDGEPINIFLDPRTAFRIIGTEMGYVDTQFEKGFSFKNPREKGRCGCGKSFYY